MLKKFINLSFKSHIYKSLFVLEIVFQDIINKVFNRLKFVYLQKI